ncbi:type IV pilus twitching motility protein PilT [Patescibacteria group bacterium]
MEATQTIIINRIITVALKRQASDLHLSVGNNPVLRVDNKLHILSDEDIITANFLNNLAKSFFSDSVQKELEEKREVTIVHNYGNNIRFRINGFYQKNFLNFSFRFIQPVLPLFKDLGLPTAVQNLTRLKSGLIIVAGGYDAGRTTTVFSFLEEINRNQSRYILTIEKPVEFLMSSNKSIIAQRNIPTDVRNYQDAIAYCEKEDVDVIMIDKIDSSPDTLMRIFELSLSGKLIISIMNGRTVVGVIEKILSQFQEKELDRVRLLLANCIECILMQKLVPRIGGGRILIPEILLATSPVKAIIKDDKIYQINNILQTSREEGMMGIDISLAERVSTGEIDVKEALNYANDKDNFKNLMK